MQRKRINRIAILPLMAMSVCAADFQSGQAARAVIGQPSFSAHQAGITPTALTISNQFLYAADASHQLLTFDLSQLPGAKDEVPEAQSPKAQSFTCLVCGFSPTAAISQSVLPGIAGVSIYGKTVVAADAANGRVLIWRDTSSPAAAQGPDVVLGNTPSSSAVSATTVMEPISVAYDGKRLFVGDAALHRVLIWNSLPASNTQPADAVLGQDSFTSVVFSDTPGPQTISRPSALVSDGTNLFVADAVDHRILVFSAADVPFPADAIVNSASMTAGPVAPGTLVTISAQGFAQDSGSVPDDGQPLPDKLGGLEVFLNGIRVPLLSVSPTQIRAQLPYGLEDTRASLYVRMQRADGTVITSNAAAVKLLPATPGLFAFGGSEPRGGMVLHAGSASGLPGAPVTADNPARPGEVLVMWAAGLGAVSEGDDGEIAAAGQPFHGPDAPVLNPVNASVAGEQAEVIGADLPQASIGIYEVRIQIPANLPSNDKTPLLVSQDGNVSNTVTIPVRTAVH